MMNKNLLITLAFLIFSSLMMFFLADEKIYKFIAKSVLFVSLVVPVLVLILYKTLGISRTRAMLVNTLLLMFTLSFMLVLAEYSVRFLFVDVTTTADNSSFFANRWRKQNEPSINSLGYREREISSPKPGDAYRIAVVGDSLTYGQGLQEEDRFSRIIETGLNENKPIHQVYNFGIPGAETVDHISFLDDVFTIDPDFILLQWFSNDVEGHDKSARPTSYRLIPSDFLTRILHQNSALYYLVNSQWTALQARLGWVGSYNDSMDMRFSDRNSVDSQRAIGELGAFIKKVRDRNIGLGIILFPNFGNEEGGVEKYPFPYLFERVVEACEENKIKCLDMRARFSEESPETLWVNRFDQHPSKLANEVAARSIIDTYFND